VFTIRVVNILRISPKLWFQLKLCFRESVSKNIHFEKMSSDDTIIILVIFRCAVFNIYTLFVYKQQRLRFIFLLTDSVYCQNNWLHSITLYILMHIIIVLGTYLKIHTTVGVQMKHHFSQTIAAIVRIFFFIIIISSSCSSHLYEIL